MDNDKETRKWLICGGLVLFGICLDWLILGLIIACNTGMREGWGQIGDSFAVINTMFSAAAVLGAVYAIILQRKDFQQTIREHEENTEAQKTIARIQAVTTQIEQCRFSLSERYPKRISEFEQLLKLIDKYDLYRESRTFHVVEKLAREGYYSELYIRSYEVIGGEVDKNWSGIKYHDFCNFLYSEVRKSIADTKHKIILKMDALEDELEVLKNKFSTMTCNSPPP